MYIQELSNWPRFHWSAKRIAAPSPLPRAIDTAQITLGNPEQRPLIPLLDGFEGRLTTSKYATLAKCSQDTAHRDILALVDHGVLVRNAEGGRSTSYSLAKSQ